MRVKRRLFGLPVGLVATFTGLFVSQLVCAQIDTGSLNGIVRTPSGERAANATVTLRGEQAHVERSTRANSDGVYIFLAVGAGTYTVKVELKGFPPATQTGVVVKTQQNTAADFSLQAQPAEGAAGASAGSPSAESQQEKGARLPDGVTVLPLYRRNFTFLAQLLPGITQTQDTRRGMEISGSSTANGVRPAQTNYQLDGVDNNSHLVDFLTGAAFVSLPALEAVQELEIQSPDYSAVLGGTSGAVMGGVTKSGTSQFHGSGWEIFGDKTLDAADFFDNAAGIGRANLRKNQFGVALGGPVAIPRLVKGNDKTFFFADYQGTRINEGVPETSTVPTSAERASGFTDYSDLIASQPGCTRGPDLLGRTVNCGTVFDPATTRLVLSGGVDPVTGKTATSTGYVRDPFAGNMLPIGRVDPVGVSLLGLFPAPTSAGIYNNFTTNTARNEHGNSFDIRVDQALGSSDQAFARFSFFDNPVVLAGPFAGFADGGGYTQISKAQNGVFSETHIFSSNFVNELRLGYSGIHAGRVQPFANNLSNIPGQYGIAAVPQLVGNGGLSTLDIGSLSPLGSRPFLYANDYSSTIQITDNVSKVYGSHTLQVGADLQRIKSATFEPPYSRGLFAFSGNFTSMPNMIDATTGITQLLLAPTTSSVPAGTNFVGGPNQVLASNMSNIDNRRSYVGAYAQDHWRLDSKTTFDLGVRWEYFEPQKENFSAEANFIPGAPGSSAKYLIPIRRQSTDTLSTSFTNLLTTDGIALSYPSRGALVATKKYAKMNFAPRVGFAYQLTSKLLVRGAAGVYLDGLENEGVLAGLGGNYPFQLNYNFRSPNDVSPIIYPHSGTNATIEQGLVGVTLTPATADANQLVLRGTQQDFKNPYTEAMSASAAYDLGGRGTIEVAYLGTLGRHLKVNSGLNEPTIILRPGEDPLTFEPYRNFAYNSSYITTQGSSYYTSGQVTYTRKVGHGLSFLGNYTYSKTHTDAHDLIFSAGDQPYRAPGVFGVGIHADYGLANFDVRHAFHFSGEYEFPAGKGRRFFADEGSIMGKVVGGWSFQWIATLQTGQPVTIPCSITTVAAGGCYALGSSGSGSGGHGSSRFWSAAAFTNPAVATFTGQSDLTPLGGKPSQATGPGFRRLDLSLHKDIARSEKARIQIRIEAYNITNHPNFALPSILDFTNPAYFGQTSATRDNPNDPRQIQVALRIYF